jgi:aminopeptidase
VSLTFEQKLENYAELIIRVGLNVQPHQRLLIQGAPLEGAPFVRALTGSAYRAGCRLVNVQWSDERLSLERFQHAPKDSFEEFADSSLAALAETVSRGDALLSISANDPELLKNQDPALVSTTMRVRSTKSKPYVEKVMQDALNWCVAAMPTQAWASKVFPDLSTSDDKNAAIMALWDAIFMTTRADQPDPVGAWKTHLATLDVRSELLNARHFTAVRFTGPGTNLRIGLPEHHLWMAGRSTTQSGIEFVANLPTEEIFTLPHKDQVDGEVSSSKPLSYAGTLIDGIHVRFEAGKIVEASAQKGQEAFLRLLDTDEGSRRIGEVALVPHQSPISNSGLLFNNTLFDENAACHIALGQAYPFTLKGGVTMDQNELSANGVNSSIVHVDWMIGSGQVSVQGEHQDGSLEPIMTDGDWVLI